MFSRALVVIAAIVCAAGARQAVKYEPARATAMHADLRAVSAVQAAVVRGDLEALRAPARLLTTLAVPTGMPDAATRHVLSITAAAREALEARDAAAAATATARMLAACGSCHREVGTLPAVAGPSLPSVGGRVGHMLDHQRAVDQLQRGLALPSDREWQEGARALGASPLHAREQPRDVKRVPELLRVEEAVHRLAEDARGASTTEARITTYSTLLARCADCHGLHKRIWGPPSR